MFPVFRNVLACSRVVIALPLKLNQTIQVPFDSIPERSELTQITINLFSIKDKPFFPNCG